MSGAIGIIPATIRYDKRIIPAAKVFFSEITATLDDGYCKKSNLYFAELYRVSEITISRWVSNLERFGYIQVEINQREKNPRKIFPLLAGGRQPETTQPLNEIVKSNGDNGGRTSTEIYKIYFPQQQLAPQQWASIEEVDNTDHWEIACKFWKDNCYKSKNIGSILAYMQEIEQPKILTGYGKGRQSIAEVLDVLQLKKGGRNDIR